MSWRMIALVVVGVVLIALGSLWLLQGVDLVHMRPILCATNCKPVTGGSSAWSTAGVITLVMGVLVVVGGARRPHGAPK